jgi:hypothetical protein
LDIWEAEYELVTAFIVSSVSIVGIVTKELVRFPAWAIDLSLFQNVQTGSRVHETAFQWMLQALPWGRAGRM